MIFTTIKLVKIKPFDTNSKGIAKEYIQVLRELLKGLNLELIHRGSTAFGIAGKGDYEDLKHRYAFSKKEYMIQKDKFLTMVVGMIPEKR